MYWFSSLHLHALFCIVLCIAKNKPVARFTRGVSRFDWLVDESSKFKLTLPTISW